jgi:hypothetical protein
MVTTLKGVTENTQDLKEITQKEMTNKIKKVKFLIVLL